QGSGFDRCWVAATNKHRFDIDTENTIFGDFDSWCVGQYGGIGVDPGGRAAGYIDILDANLHVGSVTHLDPANQAASWPGSRLGIQIHNGTFNIEEYDAQGAIHVTATAGEVAFTKNLVMLPNVRTPWVLKISQT